MKRERSAPSVDAISVFVSYARANANHLEVTEKWLILRGFSVLKDTAQIAPGERWKRRIGEMIAEADVVLCLLTSDFVASNVCQWELDHSIGSGKRVVPLLFEDVIQDELRPILRELNWLDARGGALGQEGSETATKLHAAITEDFLFNRNQSFLLQLCDRWIEEERDPSFLLRSKQLDHFATTLAELDSRKRLSLTLREYWNASSQYELNEIMTTSRLQQKAKFWSPITTSINIGFVLGILAAAVMAALSVFRSF